MLYFLHVAAETIEEAAVELSLLLFPQLRLHVQHIVATLKAGHLKPLDMRCDTWVITFASTPSGRQELQTMLPTGSCPQGSYCPPAALCTKNQHK